MKFTAHHFWRTSLAATPAHSGASWTAIGVVVVLVAVGGLLARWRR